MRYGTWILVVGAVSLVPVCASAQNTTAGKDAELQLEMRRQRMIVHPTPSADQAVRDEAEVERQLWERRTQDDLVRDATRPVPARPDLGYDVTNGVQGQTLDRLLRR